ncbi:MAG TPA: response regulator transcription factor [Acidisarcina sp.]
MQQEEVRILIVEDEEHLAQGLRFNLEAEGYAVQLESDGESALKVLEQDHAFSAVLLDVMLPGKDGFEVAAELRHRQNFIPVLMMTARGRPEDVLRGFAAGADDYLAKPFDLSILLARLGSLLRRMAWHRPAGGTAIGGAPSGRPAGAAAGHRAGAEPGSQSVDAGEQQEPALFEFEGRKIDFDALELTTPDKTIHLTLMEADLLRYLVRHRGRIVSRKELLEQVWRVHEDTDTRAIDNFMVRLRRYFEVDPTDPAYLQTVRGVGYRFLPKAGARD